MLICLLKFSPVPSQMQAIPDKPEGLNVGHLVSEPMDGKQIENRNETHLASAIFGNLQSSREEPGCQACAPHHQSAWYHGAVS